MPYNGPSDQLGYYKKTRDRMAVIKKYISENMRFPKWRLVAGWFDIEKTASSELLYKVRCEMQMEPETWEELGRKIVENILARVEDGEDPLDDALLVKLLQFYKPLKKDVQEIVGGVEVIHRLVIEKPDELLGTEEESPTE
jgi:hypothetical protein